MKDLYKILEIKETASDAEIKQAYISLKNKFDPNSYEKDSLKKTAIEKSLELDKAFDKIMDKRRLDRIKNGQPTIDTASSSKHSGDAQYEDKRQTANTNIPDLNYIEHLINSNELNQAQNLLNSINENNRPAHWFYLKGLLLLKKGWLEEAVNFFSAAVRMDPTNRTYVQALKQINWQRQGHFGPFNSGQNSGPYPQTAHCGFCETCAGMMCANAMCSCCEDGAMGGC